MLQSARSAADLAVSESVQVVQLAGRSGRGLVGPWRGMERGEWRRGGTGWIVASVYRDQDDPT